MRHQQKGFKLGRTSSHRAATLAALSNALIKHKRITTTHAKAKALRMYVEPIINRAKDDSTHSRRQAFRYLQDKEAVSELFGDVASRLGDRPGGYTRIVKLGQRAGDAAPMAVIELVDYNDVRPDGASSSGSKRRTRRGSRSRSKSGGTAKASAAAATKAADDSMEVIEADEEVDVVEDEEVEEVTAEDAAPDESADEDVDESADDEEKAS
ncbi:MAG: 50S ribosomal protein L17 [Bacteroidetes bacterium]|nr:50S ribosomal protein L17 [Bacteroidota bacterium]